MLKELKDGSIVSLEYGFSVITGRSRTKPGEYETHVFNDAFTKVYTDGEIYKYHKNNPFQVECFKIGKREYNSVNYLEVDNIYVKNHTYLIKEVYIHEWTNVGPSRFFEPQLKSVDIYVKDKSDIHQVIKALAMKRKIEILRSRGEEYLPDYSHFKIIENTNVHILRKK